jgi:hypothetical protein
VKHWIPVLVAAGACQAPLDTDRVVEPYGTFGDAIYREACQRVAYTGQLDQQAAGEIAHVDVSGALGHGVCVAEDPPPASAPRRLIAIVGERAALTATVDTVLPQPMLASLEAFLEHILPLYDDGTMERAIAGVGKLMADIHDDPDGPAGLARLSTRVGYRPASPGVAHDLLAYPAVDDFIGSFLGLVGPGGAAQADFRALLAGGAAALGTVETSADPADPERSLKLALELVLARDTDGPNDLDEGRGYPAVARDVRGLAKVTVVGGAVVAPFVDRDGDGLADVDGQGRFVGADGRVLNPPTPFPQLGVPDPAPRDGAGRALVAAGDPTTLYQYFDVDGTLLAGATREASVLLDPSRDTALGLVWGAAGLLGPRAMQTRTYRGAGTEIAVTFNGYDLAQSPALDLLHAFVQVLGAPDPGQLLASTAELLGPHESETARVIGAMLDTKDLAQAHPEAEVPATSTIHDELAPLLARTLRVPGLGEDLVKALQDPHVRGVAPMIARLMDATDRVDFNHTKSAIGAARGAPDFDLIGDLDHPTPVDRARPDVDDNRSLMQRIAQLIHDANGAQFCNKEGAVSGPRTFARCKLFKIDDLGLFFALNLASDPVRQDAARRATTYDKASFREQIVDPAMHALITDSPSGDNILQGMVGITGFKRFPTPKALARALFLRPEDEGTPQFLKDTMDPVTCTDGDRFIDVHDQMIFAWETALPGNPSGFADDTFYDAVQPLVDAFARHDECLAHDAAGTCTRAQNAIKIFVDLLAMLHEHWASPRSSYFGHTYQATDRRKPRFSYPDNVVSYEPILIASLTGELTDSLLAFAPVLDGLRTPAGQPALPALVAAMRAVFDPEAQPAELAYRDGRTTTVMSDGTTPVARVTPFYLLADAFAAKRARLAALDPAQADAWRAAARFVVDRILTVERDGAGYRFHNRRLHAVTQLLVEFLRGRVAAHAADLTAWIRRDLTQDLTDKLAGPVFAALGDLVDKVEHDAGAHAQLTALLRYLTDEVGQPVIFARGLSLLADQAQLFLDDRSLAPIVRAVGKAMDPTTGSVDAQVALLKGSHDVDREHVLLTILRRLFEPDADGVAPASDLADIVSALDRAVPGAAGDLDAADEASVLGALRDFFADERRGFVRFVAIVRNREPGRAP